MEIKKEEMEKMTLPGGTTGASINRIRCTNAVFEGTMQVKANSGNNTSET